MHKKSIINVIGLILVFLGFSMQFSVIVAAMYGDGDLVPILKSSIITISFGGIFFLATRKTKNEITVKDGFVVVTLGWIFMAIFSALPFWISGAIPTYTDSFFESMSGLTTTGATILGHVDINYIENLPHGLLFWRSFTQFIGGMGIIVFSIAMLPLMGMGGVQLFKAEVAGPTADKLTPRVKNTAKYLWSIYVGFVIILTLILWIAGMTFFDAICHSFTTIATAGFSTKNLSIGSFQSPLIESIIIIFMFLAAINFTLHYNFIFKKNNSYFKDTEFRFYILTLIIFTSIITFNIASNYYGFGLNALRHGLFTTVSLLTTTGFSTEDFASWPHLSQTVIFFLIFIGGSAGSTTGALKLIRTIVVIKYLTLEMKKMLHPKGVFLLTIGDKILKDNVVKNTLGFYLFYIFIFGFCSIILSILGLDLITSLTASAASIGNIGPGLASIGPNENWGHFPALAKWICSFCMLLGRLEIFTVLILFNYSFWKE